MPRITRRQCGCTCSNRAYWSPGGDSLPAESCDACEFVPCEYLIDLGCCVECDGLESCTTLIQNCDSRGGRYTGQRILSLQKDTCHFEGSCKYAIKANPSYSDDSDVIQYQNRIAAGFLGVCNNRSTGGDLPLWYWFFKTVGSAIVEADPEGGPGGVVSPGIPVFGCKKCDSGFHPCGLYDQRATPEGWLDFLEHPDTFDRWKLEHDATSATVTGRTDSGETVVYSTSEWSCPDPDAPTEDQRVTFTISSYPDTITDCQKFPRKICVFPGNANFTTPCSSSAAAVACCDPGWPSGTLDVNLGDCGGEHTITLFRNAELPEGVTDPEGVCGYFWATINGLCSSGGAAVTFGVLTYCDGTDWHVDLWCSLDGWHEIDTATATLTQCCPGAQFEWTWSGDWGECCCPEPEPMLGCDCCGSTSINRTLTITITSTDCPTLNGQTVTVVTTQDCGDSVIDWIATAPLAVGSCSYTLTFRMPSNTCRPRLLGFGAGIIDAPDVLSDCDPLLVTFNGNVDPACGLGCAGAGAVTFTVTG